MIYAYELSSIQSFFLDLNLKSFIKFISIILCKKKNKKTEENRHLLTFIYNAVIFNSYGFLP